MSNSKLCMKIAVKYIILINFLSSLVDKARESVKGFKNIRVNFGGLKVVSLFSNPVTWRIIKYVIL